MTQKEQKVIQKFVRTFLASPEVEELVVEGGGERKDFLEKALRQSLLRGRPDLLEYAIEVMRATA